MSSFLSVHHVSTVSHVGCQARTPVRCDSEFGYGIQENLLKQQHGRNYDRQLVSVIDLRVAIELC